MSITNPIPESTPFPSERAGDRKIAFLTPEYPHPKTGNSGGIGTSIKNLASGLIMQGCSVRVLVYGQKEDAVFEEDGITIQQIKNIKLKGLSWWLTRKKIERIINQLYKDGETDLVEAPDWTGITSFLQLKKCPIVIRLHGSDTYFCYLDQRPVKWINKFHEKRALQNADGLISVSQFTAALTNRLFGLNKEFTIIPNAIDMSLFDNTVLQTNIPSVPVLSVGTERSRSGVEVGVRNLLYFGTLIRKKGLLELPFIFNKVVDQHPAAKLILVGRDASDIISGNTSTWAMMQELFSPKALANVSYMGGIPYSEIKKHIKQATICVFPTFAEALPVSWLEAMAMQKPIVASNIGWAKEMIADGVEGFLVNPKDHSTYATKIVALLEDPELQKQFGIAARKKVEQKFSIEVVAQQSLAFYEKTVSKK